MIDSDVCVVDCLEIFVHYWSLGNETAKRSANETHSPFLSVYDCDFCSPSLDVSDDAFVAFVAGPSTAVDLETTVV